MKNLFYTYFTSLLFLIAGCVHAQTKNLGPDEFKGLLGKKNTTLIDVRSPEEFKNGHLDNAKNMNFYDSNFEAQIKNIDKTQTILLYCAVGGRSSKAAKLFEKNGFKNIVNLNGGYAAWSAKGLKTSK